MPWVKGDASGLYFLAFGSSFYAFQAVLQRKYGREDGIVDGLFQYSRPVSTAYFWCPPTRSGQLDLSRLGI
jgi:putative iron-dependent peroxidase